MDTNTLKNNVPLLIVAALVAAVVAWASTRGPARIDDPTVAALALEPGVASGTPADVSAPAQPRPVRTRPVYVSRSVPAGTTLAVALDNTLSTQTSQVGDGFTARVVQPVIVDGRTVIPSGARVSGRVVEAARSQRIGGRSRLGLELTSVRVASGERAIDASYSALGKSQTKRDAATIAGSTAGGAVLGRILGHKKGSEADGTLAGAVVGGAIGTAVAVTNRAQHVTLPAGSTIQVQLDSSLTV